jgi:hypothetical protein
MHHVSSNAAPIDAEARTLESLDPSQPESFEFIRRTP